MSIPIVTYATKLKNTLFTLLLLLLSLMAPKRVLAQNILALYNNAIPNSLPGVAAIKPAAFGLVYDVRQPSLEMYLPEKDKASGAAVIICPGGSYKVLVYEAEGVRTAKEFQKKGIAAFVLKYRLPDERIMTDKKNGPLQDAQQAIKLIREHALQWGIDSNKIGIMGFSAGGHLAATAATHYQNQLIENPLNTSLRPDFLILIYPVISMQTGLTHADSRKNLLGDAPSQATVDLFSNELQANEHTPPTYITHAGDDQVVDVDNSISFYEKLRHSHVPAELHIFPKGGHGFVLALPPDDWLTPIFQWMKNSHFIPQ